MKAGTTIVALLLLCYPPILNAQSVSGVINSYYKITAVNTITNSVTVDDATGLTPGERVLIIQSKGANINSTNTASYGDITVINNAGKYEFNTICTVAGNQVVLKGQLVNPYDPAGQLQLVSVPSYNSVTISGKVSAANWDPVAGKGGIVVIEASGTIFLNADINVSGQGFLGGALVNFPKPPYDCEWDHPVSDYYLSLLASQFYQGGKKGEGITDYILNEEYARGKLANGGGGGNNANTGGAGGGNYGKGGGGGQRSGETFFLCHGVSPGVGGLSLAGYGYTAAENRIFFGGGGGSGHENNGMGQPGGNGGGIIILSASVIAGGGGSLFADGVSPYVSNNPAYLDSTQAEGDGGGGGGAGGTVILNAASITGSVTATAKGAKGSDASNEVSDCTGPGGGGGGGMVWAAGGVFPAAVSVTVNGGANGVVSAGNTKPACRGSANGALPGDPGTSLNSYTPPAAGVNICVPLATSILKYFTADLEDNYGDRPDVLLSWGLYPLGDAAGIVNFTVERSDDRVHFSPLTTIAFQDSAEYHFTDAALIEGTVLYRLVWLDDRGLRSYSRVLAVSRSLDPGFGFIRLHPNPVQDQLNVELFSNSAETAIVKIFDARGRPIVSYPFSLHIGTTPLTLPVKALVPGTYFLVAEVMGRRQVKSFIKKE